MPVAGPGGALTAAWARCEQLGLSRELKEPAQVHSESDVQQRRRRSGLSQIVGPVWEAFSASSSKEQVMILTDPVGDVLWRYGTQNMLNRADHIGFVEGAAWSESSVGTNAISQALRTETASLVSGEQHFAHSHQTFTCMAAPITCPASGSLLGILDISGPHASMGEDIIAMVQFSARLATGLLRAQVEETSERARIRVRLLGSRPAVSMPGKSWTEVPLRSAELLAMLESRRRGWSAAELTSELYGDFGLPGTVRTEMHRLRKLLGDALLSQPYRFAEGVAVESDVGRLERLLEEGELDGALDLYTQPLLAHSSNERILQWRAWLDQHVEQLVNSAGTESQRIRWRRTEMAWDAELERLLGSWDY